MKKQRRNRFMVLVLTAVLLILQTAGAAPLQNVHAEGETADLRIMFTTDLHGQVVDIDYSKGSLYAMGGLSKAATLLKEAKAEVPEGNTLLFDLGDVMYDYTTDYIYDYDENEVQPIYQAMASLNYDAIILGNHDYEYTLPYIQAQYAATGLTDKVVVSNITDAVTGQHVWHENKIIEKKLEAENGDIVSVKVGIIGESIPTLSKKRCDYTGELAGEDMVANATKEAAALKAQGADVIVVLAHSGVGNMQPALMDENVGYALTKIPEVDVVLCGHKHAFFCADGTTVYDSYPGVDTETNLVNGKNLVMVANSGQGIGVVDLDINSSSQIAGRKSELRKVQVDTPVDAGIAAFMGKWDRTFLADSTEVLAELKNSVRWQNYLATVEDTSPVQLLNDIAINYGLKYQNNDNTDCKGLPIVAGSRYSKYGGGSGTDYYDISDYFTKADLYSLMNYRIQLWRYKVNGAQLREWLEWAASAYETAGQGILPTSGSALSMDAPDSSVEPIEEPADVTSEPVAETAGAQDGTDADKADQDTDKKGDAPSAEARKKKAGEEAAPAGTDNEQEASEAVSARPEDGSEPSETVSAGPEDGSESSETVSARPEDGSEPSGTASAGPEDGSEPSGTASAGPGDEPEPSGTASGEAVETEPPSETEQPGSTLPDGIQGSELLDGILNYSGPEPLQYSLQQKYLTDLSRFYVFDGIEYHINTSVPPRYNYDGAKINDTFRVDSVTRNGVPVNDTDEFLLIINRLDSTLVPDQFLPSAAWTKLSAADTRDFFSEYMSKQAECGTLGNLQDDNWSVGYSDQSQYVLKVGAKTSELLGDRPWIKELLDQSEEFYYYRADLSQKANTDTAGPDLNLASLKEIETNHNIQVAVQATDISGIQSLKYLSGKHISGSVAWDGAMDVQNGFFTCTKNSIYSVKAVDGAGNETIRYIRINNINEGVLEAPKVDTYTNRKSYISGTAEPLTTIIFELENGTEYKSSVKENGTFQYSLPAQKAGAKIFVYVKDDIGRASARTVVTVKRTGPNKPVLDKVTTAVRTVSGDLNDKNAYLVIILDSKKTVFMQDDGTQELYEKSELYDQSYKVEKLSMTIADSGAFTTALPYLLTAGTAVKIRTLDVAARNSMGTKRSVKQTVPAKPTMSDVTNLSKKVKVFSEEKCKSATLTVGKKTYKITKKTYVSSKKLYRYTKKITRTNSGVKVKAYLTNSKGNSSALKIYKREVVPDTPKLDKIKSGAKKITGHVDVVGNGTEEEGVTVENTNTKVFVYINGKKRSASIDFEGNFSLKLGNPVKSGMKISVKARNSKGAGLKKTVTVK